MTTYGLTSAGFVKKPLTQCVADVVAALKTIAGLTKADNPRTLGGQLAGIVGALVADGWDLAQAVVGVADPDAVTGAAQDSLCAITGTLRTQATSSKAKACYLIGTAGTPVPAGSIAATAAGDFFALTATQSIQTASAWQASHAYAVGDVVAHDSGKLFACTTAGSSAGSGGPTGTGAGIVDGGVTWYGLGVGTAASALCEFDCDVTGPIPAVAGSLTVIQTPVAGWSAVINVLDAEEGNDTETDADLRTKREQELAPGGSKSYDAIRTALLKVSGVTAAIVYFNDTEADDGNGTGAHTVRAVVQGGADADVAAALLATVAEGINTQGGTTVSVNDSEGVAHSISFERPTTVDVYVTVTLTYDATLYPADGDTEIKAAIAANGATYPIGKDVTASAQIPPAFKVPGVLDVSTVHIGTAPSPAGSTTISIDGFHLAVFDTSRIVVNSSAGTP